ncbi:MAG: HlyD family efflux transporter periplasmic adaptor subunit [Lentisphaeraceae bacterium]|nr:HlyD family efflux transporter periplasmic adaptor subunit [Lentisphaeraceae bacterium]
MKTLINIVGTVLIFGLTIVAFKIIGEKEEKPKTKISQKGVLVKAVAAKKASTQITMKLWAEVRYRKHVNLKAEVEGKVLEASSLLRPGNVISEGTQLIKLDSERLELQLTEIDANRKVTAANIKQLEVEAKTLRTEIELANQAVDLIQKDVKRYEDLVRSNSASKVTLSTFQQNLVKQKSARQQLISRLDVLPERKSSLKAQLESLEASKAKVHRDIKDSSVKSPFDALITKTDVDVGDYIRKGDSIAEIAEKSHFEVWVKVGVAEKKKLRDVEHIEILGEQIKNFRFAHSLDNQTQSDYMIFDFRSDKLLAGQLIQIEAYGEVLEDVIKLPESSLRTDRQSVYTVKDGKLAINKITYTLISNGSVYIETGLEEGETVVSSRLNELPTGTLVNVSGR